MNWKEAYEHELNRVMSENMSDVLDLLADDIWSAMGRENESLFEQAAIDDDQAEMGRIMAVAIANCAHRMVKTDAVASLCGRGDIDEAEARDAYQRREELKREVA